ncbi:MAG: ABC transporter substrate-binding protein [Reyranellaceae bacterium]
MRVLAAIVAMLVSFAAPAMARDRIEIVDLAGRTVRVPAKVERVVLGEGRLVPVLGIFDRDDPVRRVVGMMGEFELLDPAGYAQYLQRFPAIARVPRIGRSSSDSFSVEKAIALQADVAIFGVEGHGPSSRAKELIAQLEAAGTVIVFVDFRQKPLTNTRRSIEILGQVLGRQKEAADFLAFYDSQLAIVTTRLAGVSRKPSVFLESRVGLNEQCCETMVAGMMGDFVAAAGGANIARGIVPGAHGTVSNEYLLQHQPAVYIGTAIGAASTAGKMPTRIVLGAGVSADVARASLERATKRTGIAELDAVRQGRAFAIWHHFYNTPLHVAAIQAIARWLHPALFADVDPRATLRVLFERHQAVPLDGAYWIEAR